MNEINRLTNRENWFYIETANMVADLGTRKGVKIEDVSGDIKWLNRQNWCKNKGKFHDIICQRNKFK